MGEDGDVGEEGGSIQVLLSQPRIPGILSENLQLCLKDSILTDVVLISQHGMEVFEAHQVILPFLLNSLIH